MDCYIEFLDSKNGFKQTKKDFKTFEEAKKWMVENFEKTNIDFIQYY
jgi:hypothetical protein